MKYAEIIAYTNSSANSNYRYYGKALNESSIIIGNTAIDELFETLENKTVLMTREYEKQNIQFVDKNPNMEFSLQKVKKDEYIIKQKTLKKYIKNGKMYIEVFFKTYEDISLEKDSVKIEEKVEEE